MLTFVVTILCAYLIGSLSSAIFVAKAMHLPDPRTLGSKNPGATNMLRIGGKRAAALTLLGDLLKGLIPVLIVKALHFDPTLIACVAFAAFIGHLFPLYFRFQGGKGVATLLGCLLALSWPAALAWMGTWVLCALLFRYSSLAALVASILAPLYIWLGTHLLAYLYAISAMAVVLVVRHHTNIRQLIAGTEKKIGRK